MREWSPVGQPVVVHRQALPQWACRSCFLSVATSGFRASRTRVCERVTVPLCTQFGLPLGQSGAIGSPTCGSACVLVQCLCLIVPWYVTGGALSQGGKCHGTPVPTGSLSGARGTRFGPLDAIAARRFCASPAATSGFHPSCTRVCERVTPHRAPSSVPHWENPVRSASHV